MVFFEGKLYVLTQGEGFFVLIIEENKDSRPAVSTIKQMIADSHYPSFPILDIWGSPIVEARYLRHYLVVSRGQLLMVRRWLDDPHEVNAGDGDRTLSFEVFVLNSDLVGWMELKSLDGEALLISKRGSMSVASSSFEGAKADFIYFVYDTMAKQATMDDPFHDSGMYSLRDGTMIPFQRAVVPRHGRWFPAWLSLVVAQ
uniref:KIB1-4 beta-propeller domain-containing protein n=1 Tax=Arundo donax TaxID=35708 RepID=A0A0A9F5E5_ARUDO